MGSDLAHQYAGLAMKAAHRYRGRCPDDDLEQTAMLGLVTAARSFRRGEDFGKYALRCIDRELKVLIRGIEIGDPLPPEIEDTSTSVDIRLEVAETFAALARALDSLTALERALIVERFGLAGRPPASQIEIGTATGIGIDRIRAIERSALAKLRRYAY